MRIVDNETRKPFTGANHKMSVICGIGGYMCWSRICLSARGRVVKDYPYATYMAHVPMVVGIDSSYLNTVLTSMAAFAIDQAPITDFTYTSNAGLDYRCGLAPFLTDNYVPTQCGWTIEVTLNSSNFCII